MEETMEMPQTSNIPAKLKIATTMAASLDAGKKSDATGRAAQSAAGSPERRRYSQLGSIGPKIRLCK